MFLLWVRFMEGHIHGFMVNKNMQKLILILLPLLLASCVNEKQLRDDEIVGWGTPPTKEQVQEAKFHSEWNKSLSTINTDFQNNLKQACKKNKGNNALQEAITNSKNSTNIKAIKYVSDSVYIYSKINSEVVFLADSYARTGKTDLCDSLKEKQVSKYCNYDLKGWENCDRKEIKISGTNPIVSSGVSQHPIMSMNEQFYLDTKDHGQIVLISEEKIDCLEKMTIEGILNTDVGPCDTDAPGKNSYCGSSIVVKKWECN